MTYRYAVKKDNRTVYHSNSIILATLFETWSKVTDPWSDWNTSARKRKEIKEYPYDPRYFLFEKKK